VDDPEIPIPVVDEGLGVRTDEGDFAPGHPSRFLIPNPSDPAPTFHLVGATTLRDLDVLEGNVDNTDVVVKTEVTSCPINLATGRPKCFRGGCADEDDDQACDDIDNCPFVWNPEQEDCCTPGGSGPDGIGDACQCGDVTGDGQVNSFDATMIKRKALNLSAPLFNVPGNCDVTGDGNCNSFDATMIARKAINLSAPLFGNECPNYTGELQ
jgi:hypothetical protein